jgi:hypothetical protein
VARLGTASPPTAITSQPCHVGETIRKPMQGDLQRQNANRGRLPHTSPRNCTAIRWPRSCLRRARMSGADTDAEFEAAREAVRVALERFTAGEVSVDDLLAAGSRFELAAIAARRTDPPPYG